LDFAATMTPLPEDAVDVVVDAMVDAGVALPGINGEAATAARFAGCWTERHRTAARPIDGQRIYELGVPVAPVDVPGRLRQAGTNDRDRILAWMQGFDADTGERTSERRVVAEARIAAGQFSLWEEGEPVSMAAFVASAAGVARIQAVYTPPDLRRNGYASACVAGLSGRLRDSGLQCMLYADLGNPSSNSVYRRIGYRAVAECLRYRSRDERSGRRAARARQRRVAGGVRRVVHGFLQESIPRWAHRPTDARTPPWRMGRPHGPHADPPPVLARRFPARQGAISRRSTSPE
jgi:GNAT superfamily N-acetyltransferase